MKELRIGVIGAGWFASRRHLPDIVRHPDLELAALCRRDPEALALIRKHFPCPETYTDWREMLERCVLDAVLIATPHNLHFEQARAALERGLNVLLEKPMTIRAAEARGLRDLAKAKGLTLAVAVNPPYWAHCHSIREAIRSGRIGEVEAISFYWTGNAEFVFGLAERPADLPGIVPPTLYRADPVQNGGGYFIDGGSHLVSEVLWVTGLRARRVSCQMDSQPGDLRAILAITLENGAVATVVALGNSKSDARRVRNTIGGSGGTITVEGFDFLTTVVTDGEESIDSFRERDLPPVSGPVANFADAVLGRANLHAPPEHGVHVVEVIEAAYESAGTGRTITIQT